MDAQRKKYIEILNKVQSISFDSEEHYELKNILMIAPSLRPGIYSKMKFKTGEEMALVLYYLVRVEGMSRKDIAALFGMNIDTIRLRLESLGLSVDHKEGIILKKIRGSQNYDKTNLSIKKTRLDSQIKQHSTGSKNEDALRKKLSLFIYDYIGEKYETVVGLSNTGILGGGKEIDIPIIIYSRDSQQIFRFAVEYNGAQYHKEQRDIEKKNVCESLGWHYLSVDEDSGNQLSNNPKLIENEARRLCEEIRMMVQNSK